jgi:citrate lyase subunit beta/citryl-CoA lyase
MDPMSRPARSWLFVPATQPKRFAKAVASGADRVIIDLEDAVAPEAKRDAGRQLPTNLPGGVPLYLRINGFGTDWFEEDLTLAAKLPFTGVVLPKAETAEQILAVAVALREQQTVIPLVESALGVWNVLEVARAGKVERLAFGSIDLQLDTGIRGEEIELAYARSRVVIASRVAKIAAPLDSISLAIDDESGVKRDAERARSFGFGGKLCIHPRQVAPINRAFLPSQEDVDWARGLIEALAATSDRERGAFSYRGSLVDRPVIERAKQILALVSSTPTGG